MDNLESKVRSYCRSFPVVFSKAQGDFMYDDRDRPYLDFLSGCGSLNYGHNHPELKDSLLSYIKQNGVAMSMDLTTDTKTAFMAAFQEIILAPRGFVYKLQFPGPTGTNAVEASIKLARKITGRARIVAFTNAFHGCTLGALALTANNKNRESSLPFISGVHRIPYDGYFENQLNSARYLDDLLCDSSSGVDIPAAIILETIQGEGGINVANDSWLVQIAEVAKKHDILLIIDDIQAGCGRSGDFFSFEKSGIKPDIVCLAKSISGFGLPMSILLVAPEMDQWDPGEHNGTFRGNNHAFVTATKALELFWRESTFKKQLGENIDYFDSKLQHLVQSIQAITKGRGMMRGISMDTSEEARQVQQKCFQNGLILETSGAQNQVIKLLPPLTISMKNIDQAFDILTDIIN